MRLAVAAVAVVVAALPVTLLGVLVIAAWDPLRDLDETAARGLHDAVVGHPVAVDVLKAWTNVFSPWPFRLAVVALAGWLIHRGAPRLAAWALVTIVTGGVLGVLAKALVRRGSWCFGVRAARGLVRVSAPRGPTSGGRSARRRHE